MSVNIPKSVSPKARKLLRILLDQSETAATTLATMLCTMAENGGNQATDQYLVDEAWEISSWANNFVRAMSRTT